MNLYNDFLYSPVITSIIDYVGAQGISLEIGSDFSLYEAHVKSQPRRHAVGPFFSADNDYLCEATAFWIVGRDNKGELVHTQAVRTLDLEGKNFTHFMDKHLVDFFPYEIDEEKTGYYPSPESEKICGTVCYHGELWLSTGNVQSSFTGLVALLSRLAMAVSVTRFHADYFFAYIMSRNANRGLAARCGFMHTDPNSVVWSVPGGVQDAEAWSAWVSRKEIFHLNIMTLKALNAVRDTLNMEDREQRKAA